jgi:pimeloyl-ACP methyl ester carboxylesterase
VILTSQRPAALALRVAGGTGIALAAVGAASAGYQALADARARRRYPPPGRLVDIGGRRLHIFDAGRGRPTIVILSALSTPAAEWVPIQRALSDTVRVVLVDRAGVGWSDRGPWPRTAGTMADELHALLATAQIPPPYLIAGHSSGGLIARMFTARHPELMAGLVLIDSSHEDQWRRLGLQGGAYRRRALRRQLRPLGLARLAVDLGRADSERAWAERVLLPEFVEAGAAMSWSSRQRRASVQELWGFEPSGAEVATEAAGPGRFGRLPMLVLTSTADWDWRGGVAIGKAAEERRRFYAAWWPMQLEIVALSEDSHHVVAERAGHHIHRDDPEFVIQQIRGFLGRLRGN